MANGLLVRDFFKEYRELRYTSQGSIEFTDIEKNAYRLALTLEVTHLDAPRYSNLKTLPENTHFGYCTLFRGSTVTELIPVKYPKFRIFDIINQGIWNYHQGTESLQLLAASLQATNETTGNAILDAILGEDGARLCLLIRLLALIPGEQPSTFLLRVLDCDEPQGDNGGVMSEDYRGFPVASPFPDIAKFKADVPCSFLWRLESWYLVNPAVYIVDSPTDDGDETEGESEYPEPEQGDGDGDGNEFPIPSPKDPDRDPRDYGDSNEQPPFVGGQCAVMYDVLISYSDIFNGTPRRFDRTLRVVGPVGGLSRFSDTDGELSLFAGSQKHRTGLVSYPFPCSTSPDNYSGCSAKIESVVRVDGGADNCGNPSPGIVGELT